MNTIMGSNAEFKVKLHFYNMTLARNWSKIDEIKTMF